VPSADAPGAGQRIGDVAARTLVVLDRRGKPQPTPALPLSLGWIEFIILGFSAQPAPRRSANPSV
jgi:hypothetical protein